MKIHPQTEVPIKHVKPGTNVRAGKPDCKQLEASVRQVGVLLPLLVVQHTANSYHVISGHRRLAAANAAGLEVVPVRLVEGASLADRQNLQLAENVHRLDLSPMEKARAIETLRATLSPARKGVTVSDEDLALHCGVEPRTVARLLSLLVLPKKAQDAITDGLLSVSVGVELARVPDEKLRIKATNEAIVGNHREGPMRVGDVRRYLRLHVYLRLREAPFPTDADLAPGGPCGPCPKRTGNTPALLGIEPSRDDLCTDGACFRRKADEHWKTIKHDTAAAGLPVLTTKQAVMRRC